jgi:hypothetical protein
MPSPYAPLATLLANQPPETTTVTLTLPEIEAVLGRALPAGAWARGWWHGTRYGERPHPWAAVGWQAVAMAMGQVPPTVTFARVPSDSTA